MGDGRDYCFDDRGPRWHDDCVPVKAKTTNGVVKTLNNNPLAIAGYDEMTEKTLYEIKDALTDKIHYGYKLAVNSLSQWVMEIKGSGEVITTSKENVTEVLPYTIEVQYKEGGTSYNYFNEARDLVVGDFFINAAAFEPGGGGYQIGRVTKVDTKSKQAKSELKYFKKL